MPARPFAMPHIPIEISARSFLINWLVCLVPTWVAGFMATTLFAYTPSNAILDGLNSGKVASALLLLCVFAPLVETCLLLYPTHLASLAMRSRWLVLIVGASPVILIHALPEVQRAAVVAWAFLWSTHCYLVLTAQRVSIKARFWFVCGLHAALNLSAVVGASLLVNVR
jgi:hypothetical protein